MRSRRIAGHSMRLLAALIVAAVVAAGCGGGDDDSDAAAQTDDPTIDDATSDEGAGTEDGSDAEADGAGADDGEPDAEAEAGADDAPTVDAAAAGTATVTIDGTTYVADQQVVCVQIGDAIGGSWNNGDDIAISIDLPPQDWETSPDGWTAPTVRVDDDSDAQNPQQFQANPEMAAMLGVGEDSSAVTAWTVDGASASGTGTFVEFFGSMAATALGEDAPAPVDGSFSLTCE